MASGMRADLEQQLLDYLRSQGIGVDAGQLHLLTAGQPPTPVASNIPVPGQPPPPAPNPGGGLTQIPTGPTGPPGFAPPPVSMPAPLPNPTPQGLGGMPMIRDRMMGATMAPFAQPNWGVPQVPQQYLTSQQPLPGGSVAGIGVTQPQVGMAGPQRLPLIAPQTQKEPMAIGLGQIPGMRIPRKVPQGMGTR